MIEACHPAAVVVALALAGASPPGGPWVEEDCDDLVAAVGMPWGPCEACPEDIDGDGVVGFGDLVIVLCYWE